MKRIKPTVSLERFADEAKAESVAVSSNTLAESADSRLALLKRNIGKTVIVPTEYLVIQDNIRQMIDTVSPDFKKLVNSIRDNGVKQNLIGDLRILPDDKWQIICVAGQRRLLAALQAGREQVPVRLEQYSNDAARLVDALSENLLRANLHSLDTSVGYLRLLNAGWTETQIADAFERKRDTVMKMLRLARFPQAAHELIRKYPELFTSTVLLTKFVAKAWPSEDLLLAAMQNFLDKSQATRKTSARKVIDSEIVELLGTIEKLGGKATAKGNLKLGQLTLRWGSENEFSAVVKLLCKSNEQNC